MQIPMGRLGDHTNCQLCDLCHPRARLQPRSYSHFNYLNCDFKFVTHPVVKTHIFHNAHHLTQSPRHTFAMSNATIRNFEIFSVNIFWEICAPFLFYGFIHILTFLLSFVILYYNFLYSCEMYSIIALWKAHRMFYNSARHCSSYIMYVERMFQSMQW